MMESVRAESRDRARSTQIASLRWKLDGAVPELTMDGGPRIRAGLGDPGFSDPHHPAFCNPLPARDGPLTDGAAACEYTMVRTSAGRLPFVAAIWGLGSPSRKTSGYG
jgi:hypothetical protein